ncbi:MAG: histidine ammonia-lyase [Coxiellaceae bacterium]|nr:histidine ammonia-lyase [Coxiellaceae bacterium]
MEIVDQQATTTLHLNPGHCSIEQLKKLYQGEYELQLDTEYYKAVQASIDTVSQVLKNGQTVYGINTGFGLMAHTSIDHDQLSELQTKLVRSHTAGVGAYLDANISRLVMILKINSLAQGYSGVRPIVIDTMIKLFNENLIPCIHSQGSVGASGDLAPLADLASVLIGEGEVHYNNEIIAAKSALKLIHSEPLQLVPKEGLALLNGTQASTAVALAAVFRTQKLFDWALISGAMSVDAICGSTIPFDERIHAIRKQPGQIEVAKQLRNLLAGSSIRHAHLACNKVQDAYSFRCQPQVMGACHDQIKHVFSVLHQEANAVTDNPLIFAADDEIISGGNFHAEPVAFAADNLALAIAEIGSISERRLAQLVDPHFSQLPAFLVENGGINSGFMIPQVTAAALVSENKMLSHPASVDTIPTSANQEDHVSMATHGAVRLHRMCDNLEHIIAIELLAAAQGLDFRAPLKTSERLQQVHKDVRQRVPHYDEDRRFSEDIAAIRSLVSTS